MLVVGGNWNVLDNDETYSGVVGMDTIRMGFVLGELNNLKCCAADVSSTYLHGITREKVYFIAGPEFGEFEGRILIIYKSIYGLASSGARWHEVMSGINAAIWASYQAKLTQICGSEIEEITMS